MTNGRKTTYDERIEILNTVLKINITAPRQLRSIKYLTKRSIYGQISIKSRSC